MLVLVLPFVVHWSYRCFFYSGGVHLLALVSPITGIVLDFVWYRNMHLFVAFTVLMLLSAGLDFHFHAGDADDGLLADKRGPQPVFAMVAFYVSGGGLEPLPAEQPPRTERPPPAGGRGGGRRATRDGWQRAGGAGAARSGAGQGGRGGRAVGGGGGGRGQG